MKYLFIAIALFIAQPALAAKTVTGSVPQVQPLQPPAANTNPNVNSNIQYSDPSHAGEFDSQGNLISSPQDQQSGQVQDNSQPSAAAQPAQAPSHTILWLILVLAILLAGAWGLRQMGRRS